MARKITEVDAEWAWSPYEPNSEQPWNLARAAHLYRRAGFGATSRQLQDAVKQDPADVVATFLAPGNTSAFEEEMDSFGKTILAARSAQSLSAWWLYRMINTPDQTLEKATLFWHGHFATSAEKVTDAKLMLQQNDLLRKYARGNFEQLVHRISRDPAMLIYLDSTTNRKTHPNENYARELMELFCLGLGNYSEKDIQEIARCFTGWEVLRGNFRFNSFQHDEGTKSFLGQSGKYGGEDAVRIVVSQNASAQFIVSKLIRFFVLDEPQPPMSLVEPLAQELRDHEFHVGRVLKRIFNSQLFFSRYALSQKIRSPVELAVGLIRSLEVQTNLNRVSQLLEELGQRPFYPPNVKGWDGGRTWINSSTLLGRANLVRQILTDDSSKFGGGDLESLTNRNGVKAPKDIVQWLLDALLAVEVQDNVREQLTRLASEQQIATSKRISNVIHAISTLPEFQLC